MGYNLLELLRYINIFLRRYVRTYLLTYLLTYPLTDSMEQSPSWEVNRFSVKELPAFYGTRRSIAAFTSCPLPRPF